MKNNITKPVGFNLTESKENMLYKIAAFLHVNKTKAVIKIFDFLFEELVNDRGFRVCCEAWDRSQRRFDKNEKIVFTGFNIPADYKEKFEELMYDFGFIRKSPFLRFLIDYVYNNKVSPIEESVLHKIQKDLEGLEYKIEHIAPLLNGKIFVFIDNPYKSRKKRTKTKKVE